MIPNPNLNEAPASLPISWFRAAPLLETTVSFPSHETDDKGKESKVRKGGHLAGRAAGGSGRGRQKTEERGAAAEAGGSRAKQEKTRSLV